MDIFKRIPPKYRKWVYDILTLVMFVYGVWRASEGDWEQFAASMVTSVIGQVASSNVSPDKEIPST